MSRILKHEPKFRPGDLLINTFGPDGNHYLVLETNDKRLAYSLFNLRQKRTFWESEYWVDEEYRLYYRPKSE